ncbi:hypothetical protein AN1V17_28390 [Vallitalea sediminicola]
MMIYGILLIIVILTLVQYYIEWSYKTNGKKLYKVLFYSGYFIEYSLYTVISYFITDAVTDFLIVTGSFLLMHIMFTAISREWFISKLFVRLIMMIVIPVIYLFILINISQLVLIYNVFNVFMVIAIMANCKQRSSIKRNFIEFAIFALSFIACFILLKQNNMEEIYNKPQVQTINKMVDVLEIDDTNIMRIGRDGGLRGELIDISIETTKGYYIVYYKDGKIVKYEKLH